MAGRGAGESIVMTVVDAVSVRPPARSPSPTPCMIRSSSEGCSTNVDALVVTRSVAAVEAGLSTIDGARPRKLQRLLAVEVNRAARISFEWQARWRAATPLTPPLTHATTSWRFIWRKMLAFDVSRSTPSIVTYASARNPYLILQRKAGQVDKVLVQRKSSEDVGRHVEPRRLAWAERRHSSFERRVAILKASPPDLGWLAEKSSWRTSSDKSTACARITGTCPPTTAIGQSSVRFWSR